MILKIQLFLKANACRYVDNCFQSFQFKAEMNEII